LFSKIIRNFAADNNSIGYLLSAKSKDPAWSISPDAVKKQKFDPYKKKFTDMRIMEAIGSHI